VSHNGHKLLPHHRRMLEVESAIAPDVIAERGWFSVTKKQDLEGLGFGRSLRYEPTLAVPIHGVVAGELPWYMHRPDETPIKDGRPRKYMIPAGRKLSLDVHPRARPHLGNPQWPLFITEGPKKVDALISAGARAVVGLVGVWTFRGTNSHGGKTWLPDWEWVALKDGRQVYVVYDSDVMLKEEVRLALDRIGAALSRIGARVAFVYLPSGEGGAKVGADDYLAQGHSLEDLVSRASTTMRRPAPATAPAKPVEEVPPVKLADAIATFRRWLYMPDPELLYVLWGAIAANRLPGDPVWLVLVDVSGGGKTEAIRACGDLPECAHIGALTEAGLLSGSSAAERAEDATGGVLRIIGARGVIVAKDFTSVLAMEKDSRGRVLAALREIYDGRWLRQLGTDGGRALEWEGKAGFVAGVTHEIDRHYAVMARMGERLLLWRAPQRGEAAVDRTVGRALRNMAVVERMRTDLRRAALGVFAGLPKTPPGRTVTTPQREWLIELAKLVAHGRAGIITEYNGDIADIVPPELPTRLAMELEGLLAGMDYVGVPRLSGIRAMTNTGLGCIPAPRRRVLDRLTEGEATTTEVAVGTGLPSRSARRALEALTAHGLVLRRPQGPGKADRWELTEAAARTLGRAAELTSMSVDHESSGIPGTPSEEASPGTLPEIPEGVHSGDTNGGYATEEDAALDAWRRGDYEEET
jgi:DNA-binding transcriptional ArsR family regulator